MNKTVHSPLFFRKIVEILRVLPLMADILIFKCTEEAGVGDYSSRWRETNFFFFLPQTVPRPLSRLDTHPRWPSVTELFNLNGLTEK